MFLTCDKSTVRIAQSCPLHLSSYPWTWKLINEGLQKLRQDSQCTGSAVLNDDSFWMEDFDACSCQAAWNHRIVVWEKQKPDGEQGSLHFGDREEEN